MTSGSSRGELASRRAFPLTVFPAKAGTQIHPERLVGFTWAPAFAGETEVEYGVGCCSSVPSVLSHSRTCAWGTTRPASTSASAMAAATSSGRSSSWAGGKGTDASEIDVSDVAQCLGTTVVPHEF